MTHVENSFSHWQVLIHIHCEKLIEKTTVDRSLRIKPNVSNDICSACSLPGVWTCVNVNFNGE